MLSNSQGRRIAAFINTWVLDVSSGSNRPVAMDGRGVTADPERAWLPDCRDPGIDGSGSYSDSTAARRPNTKDTTAASTLLCVDYAGAGDHDGSYRVAIRPYARRKHIRGCRP